MNNGKIYVVGIGPGNMEDISIRAYNILKNILKKVNKSIMIMLSNI